MLFNVTFENISVTTHGSLCKKKSWSYLKRRSIANISFFFLNSSKIKRQRVVSSWNSIDVEKRRLKRATWHVRQCRVTSLHVTLRHVTSENITRRFSPPRGEGYLVQRNSAYHLTDFSRRVSRTHTHAHMFFTRDIIIIYSTGRKMQNTRSLIQSDPPAASITRTAVSSKTTRVENRGKKSDFIFRKIFNVNFSLITERAYKMQFSTSWAFVVLTFGCTLYLSIDRSLRDTLLPSPPSPVTFSLSLSLSLSIRLFRRKFGITSENASVSRSAHSEYNITPAARGGSFSPTPTNRHLTSRVSQKRELRRKPCVHVRLAGRFPCGASFEVVPGPIPTVSFGLDPA